jgi:cell division protein FtsB
MIQIDKISFYLGIFLVLVLLGVIFFSRNGVFDYRELKQQEAGISTRIRQVEKENRQLEKEIRSLKKDANYIKHLAKHEYGMVEPDELIFKDLSKEKETAP